MDMIQDNYNIDKNACKEVYVILNRLKLYNRIPEEMRIYIEKNQNEEHAFDFNEKAPLFYQVENEATKTFLTYLFIKYINTNEKDAQMCKEKIVDIMKKIK